MPPQYCIDCRYPLAEIQATACPECGRTFDPANPRTTSAYPITNTNRTLAAAATVMTGGLYLLTAAAVIWSGIAMDPMGLWLIAIALSPVLLTVLALVLTPALPISRRTRAGAIIAIVVFTITVITGWPMRVPFMLYRSTFEARVATIQAEGIDAPGLLANVGTFRVLAVRQSPHGNIGFQLSGSTAGGVYLVHRAPSTTWVWYNTNWERDLGDGWFLVYED